MAAPPSYTSGVKIAGAPLLGTERIFLDNGGTQGEMGTVAEVAGFGTVAAQVYNTSALAAPGTLTAANISGGTDTTYLGMTGAFGANAAITLPTAAALAALTSLAASNPLAIGSTYVLRVINPSGYTLTMTTNTGWTLNGTMTIATNTFRDFIVTLTGAATATLQEVGGGNIV